MTAMILANLNLLKMLMPLVPFRRRIVRLGFVRDHVIEAIEGG